MHSSTRHISHSQYALSRMHLSCNHKSRKSQATMARRFALLVGMPAVVAAASAAVCSVASSESRSPVQGVADQKGWFARWEQGMTNWHKELPNPALLRYFREACPKGGCSTIVPLCGKTKDMLWLADSAGGGGGNVYGFELVEDALVQFQKDNDLQYHKDVVRNFVRFQSKDVSVTTFAGDFFEADMSLVTNSSTKPALPTVAYDRGSMVALPLETRQQYANKLLSLLAPGGRVLLIGLQYESPKGADGKPGPSPGPPHALYAKDLRQIYPDCDIRHLDTWECDDPPPKFAKQGITEVNEVAFLITKLDKGAKAGGRRNW